MKQTGLVSLIILKYFKPFAVVLRIPLFKDCGFIKRFFTTTLVTLIMIAGILGITNPGFKQPYKFFDNMEGKLTHNYFIFSIYRQYYGDTTTGSGKYIVYKRYIAIALNFL